jgi:hypothetical protein
MMTIGKKTEVEPDKYDDRAGCWFILTPRLFLPLQSLQVEL